MSLIKKTRLILTIQCDEASLLTSESFDRKLAFHERLAVAGHRIVCWSCRQFEKQLRVMRDAFRADGASKMFESEEQLHLPDDVRLRLKKLSLPRESDSN